MEIGKFAIAYTLLPLERMEGLFDEWHARRVKPEPDANVPGDWYELLYNMLTEGCTFEEITFADLGITTFNYDRSLEHYLHTVLRNSYGKTDKEAADKLNELRLIHVYGSLGRLPWQPGTAPVVAYGRSGPDRLKHAAESLKILHETMRDTSEFEEARGLIQQAQRVHFLGFGFHDANLERLGMEGEYDPGVFSGTVRGLSNREIMRARKFKGLQSMPASLGQFSPGGRWQNTDVYTYLRDQVSL
jgi:hypothetical protein